MRSTAQQSRQRAIDPCQREMASVRLPELRERPYREINHAIQVDTCLDPHTVEQSYNVFCGDITRRTWRKWTPTEPANRRVESGHSRLKSGQDVGEPAAIRVVQMEIELDIRKVCQAAP